MDGRDELAIWRGYGVPESYKPFDKQINRYAPIETYKGNMQNGPCSRLN